MEKSRLKAFRQSVNRGLREGESQGDSFQQQVRRLRCLTDTAVPLHSTDLTAGPAPFSGQ